MPDDQSVAVAAVFIPTRFGKLIFVILGGVVYRVELNRVVTGTALIGQRINAACTRIIDIEKLPPDTAGRQLQGIGIPTLVTVETRVGCGRRFLTLG